METNTLLRLDAIEALKQYMPIRTDTFSGVVSPAYLAELPHLEEVISDFFQYSLEGEGDKLTENIFAKRLHTREKYSFPPLRFVNNSLLYKLDSERHYDFVRPPQPIALLYKGELLDTLSGKNASPLYLAENIDGKNLLTQHKNLKQNELKGIVSLLGSALNKLQEKSLCPLDFAPRDLVLPDEDFPYRIYFVDNENLLSLNPDGSDIQEGIQELIKEFRRAYSSFHHFEELLTIFEEGLRKGN